MTASGEGAADRPRRSRRLLVIHNPVAGRRRRKRFQAVLGLLEGAGDGLTLSATEAPGDATRLAARVEAGAFDLVVAAGGDGTINEVINGLVAEGRPAPPPLAIVPLGTSNVLAAEIGLGKSPPAVARAIGEGTTRRVSLGRIAGAGAAKGKGRHFILMAGAGIDGHAVAAVHPGLKRGVAQGAYLWAGVRQIVRARRQRYAVEVDGRRHEAAWVVVAKASRYGGPFVMAARARLDEPRFEVCLFDPVDAWAMARYGTALALGRLAGTPGFTSVLGRRVRISAVPGAPGERRPDEPVQCDGDDVTRLPARIEVVPEALSLVVPRDGRYG